MTKQDIENKYPELFENCWEFDCDNTWLEAIDKLCGVLRCRNNRYLNTSAEHVGFSQIKVKFGFPRIYLLGGDRIDNVWAKRCENYIVKKYINETEIT